MPVAELAEVPTENLTPEQWFVEETMPDEAGYKTVYVGGFLDALQYLFDAPAGYHLELWSQGWTNTAGGYAPPAFKRADGTLMLGVLVRLLLKDAPGHEREDH